MNRTTHPGRSDAAEYFFTYIDKVPDGEILHILENQVAEISGALKGVTDATSLYRYRPEKWSIRQTMNHISDTERVFLFRAVWFARGFSDPLPSFNQDAASAADGADNRPWQSHLEEFRAVRASTLTFFRHVPREAWARRGTAGGNPFTVNALAYIIAGHANHHLGILRERYLTEL
jgi:hypothetical protein